MKAKEQAAIEQERKAAAEQSYQDAIREAADDAREIRRKEEEAEKVKKAEAAAARAAAARKEVSVGKMEQKADSSKPPKLAKAPNRVPSIVSWKQRDDGTYILSRIQSADLAHRLVFAFFNVNFSCF